MQKRDLFNHAKNFDKWREEITPDYIEEGLTEPNSKIFVDYFDYLGKTKSKGHAYRNRTKIKSIFIGLQDKGVSNISKVTEKQVTDYFLDWCKNHTIDYPKRFLAFWTWWKKKNRQDGKIVQDIILDLKDFRNGSNGESKFVWLTKEEFDKFRKHFDEDKQTILLFCYDTIIRAPTELSSLRGENVFEKNGEVWVNIPSEISKTIGRKFNLVYSGEAVLKYIKKHDKKPEDYLFEFSSVMLNKEMQRIAKQLWDNKKSEGGEFYKNITMYDLRHSGAIHFRQLFQKTGQSLDLLRERGGWSDFKMINYYTKRLGLTGHISKEKLLLEEDKNKLEKDIEVLKKNQEIMQKRMMSYGKLLSQDPIISKRIREMGQEVKQLETPILVSKK